jgi:hypothetical protein
MAADYPTEPCRSCGALVIWCTTTNGNPAPIDAEPAPDGNVRLEPRDGRGPLARVLTKAELAGTSFGATGLRKNHFATCAHDVIVTTVTQPADGRYL